MYYNAYHLNKILDVERQYHQFLTYMKQQESLAIQAVIKAKYLELQNIVFTIEQDIQHLANKMYHYASNTYVNHIKDGFEGEIAQQAEHYLTSVLAKPDLKNPVKLSKI